MTEREHDALDERVFEAGRQDAAERIERGRRADRTTSYAVLAVIATVLVVAVLIPLAL